VSDNWGVHPISHSHMESSTSHKLISRTRRRTMRGQINWVPHTQSHMCLTNSSHELISRTRCPIYPQKICIHTQKSLKYTQKSSTNTQKSPKYTQKSPKYIQKSSINTQMNPICTLKRALNTLKRALQTLKWIPYVGARQWGGGIQWVICVPQTRLTNSSHEPGAGQRGGG